MKVILIRFLIGAVAVSIFAVLGDLFKPKSFAGLFGAAPSVALATLGLTVASDGSTHCTVTPLAGASSPEMVSTVRQSASASSRTSTS